MMHKGGRALLFLTLVFPAVANSDAGAKPPSPVEMAPVVTAGAAHIGGVMVHYHATVGYLVLPKGDDSDNPKSATSRAEIFYVAYTRDGGGDPVNRPIAFCFNGGPGSATGWLHLGLGPYRVDLPAIGGAVSAPYRLVDNESSWLDQTDLVFVDPVPTGYSHPAPGIPVSDFEGYENDRDAAAQFIAQYLQVSRRWPSPKILVGESYGTIRVAGVAEILPLHYHIAINGLVLISQALNYADTDTHTLMALPTEAAIAWYHGKIASRFRSQTLEAVCRAAETFARDEYAPALFQGDALPDDRRQEIAERLSEFTGLPANDILTDQLQIPENSLFRKERLQTALYDGRQVIPPDSIDTLGGGTGICAFQALLDHTLAVDLGFPATAPYRLFTSVDWGEDNRNANYARNFAILGRDLAINPQSHILIT